MGIMVTLHFDPDDTYQEGILKPELSVTALTGLKIYKTNHTCKNID